MPTVPMVARNNNAPALFIAVQGLPFLEQHDQGDQQGNEVAEEALLNKG